MDYFLAWSGFSAWSPAEPKVRLASTTRNPTVLTAALCHNVVTGGAPSLRNGFAETGEFTSAPAEYAKSRTKFYADSSQTTVANGTHPSLCATTGQEKEGR